MKLMTSKYGGRCKASGNRVQEGDQVLWLGKGKGVVSQESLNALTGVWATIVDFMAQGREPCTSFTIERKKGETYCEMDVWTLYGHGEYGRSSVLAGQSKRCYIEDIGTERDAETFMSAVPKWLTKFVDKIDGSTHVSVDSMVAHLPEDEW